MPAILSSEGSSSTSYHITDLCFVVSEMKIIKYMLRFPGLCW